PPPLVFKRQFRLTAAQDLGGYPRKCGVRASIRLDKSSRPLDFAADIVHPGTMDQLDRRIERYENPKHGSPDGEPLRYLGFEKAREHWPLRMRGADSYLRAYDRMVNDWFRRI